MDINITTENLHIDIYGYGSFAIDKDYIGKVFQLSGKMWEVVKANDIRNKGKNIWVYDNDDKVFAGVELESPAGNNFGLEKMTIDIDKYAYFKHIGSYKLIKHTGQQMTDELTRQGYEIVLPYIEIYGHWHKDESKLETELIMRLK